MGPIDTAWNAVVGGGSCFNNVEADKTTEPLWHQDVPCEAPVSIDHAGLLRGCTSEKEAPVETPEGQSDCPLRPPPRLAHGGKVLGALPRDGHSSRIV